MGLVINHNLMAMNTARNLSIAYGRLAISTQRLSSGLRVNSGADDAAGLAVRETMRADIAVINQGVRNAGDAISMIQTADGALSVVDEKLIRMKELAEQAATGTYSTAQRLIMDGEYQAMAAEIDRIANATDFNGVKLLDGSLSTLHASGMKIHFGTGNSSAEDYYYIRMNDMRATTTTGLHVGGGATADIFTNNNLVSGNQYISAGYFAFGYNQGGTTDTTATAIANIAGFYQVTSGVTTLSDLVAEINQGTAARVAFTLGTAAVVGDSGTSIVINGTKYAIAVTTDASAGSFAGYNVITLASANTLVQDQAAFISAINALGGPVWAVSGDSSTIYLFARQAGVAGNAYLLSENLTNGYFISGGTSASSLVMSGGGVSWAVADKATANGGYNLRLTGASKGLNYRIGIQDPSSFVATATAIDNYNAGVDFTEVAGSGSGSWAGADILTQSSAQEAMAQISTAINTKDAQRANLGALQNRFQNTITNLQIQAENTQAAESRISDVDIATEMTNFTRNSILTQAATAMLAQANAFSRLALQLLGGGGGGI
jgi:flagellin